MRRTRRAGRRGSDPPAPMLQIGRNAYVSPCRVGSLRAARTAPGSPGRVASREVARLTWIKSDGADSIDIHTCGWEENGSAAHIQARRVEPKGLIAAAAAYDRNQQPYAADDRTEKTHQSEQRQAEPGRF